MSELIVVKLGGSLITDKASPNCSRPEVIARLASEVSAWLATKPREHLLITHGSGSFGHAAALGTPLVSAESVVASPDLGSSSRQSELRRAASRTQLAASRLHAIVRDHLEEAGVDTFSLAPSSFLLASAGELDERFSEPLARTLEGGLVPVLYGDVVLDRRCGAVICSTETVLEWVVDDLSRRADVRRILWLGATDGILDVDGQRIDRVDENSLDETREATGASGGIDTTGGMRLRLDTAWRFAERGIPSWILDGSQARVLGDALSGRRVGGTEVSMSAADRSSAATGREGR